MQSVQTLYFDFDIAEDVRILLRSLAKRSELREGSDFFFFSQLPGQAEFSVDCELIDSGVMVSRAGHYSAFFDLLTSSLRDRFGSIEASSPNDL